MEQPFCHGDSVIVIVVYRKTSGLDLFRNSYIHVCREEGTYQAGDTVLEYGVISYVSKLKNFIYRLDYRESFELGEWRYM